MGRTVDLTALTTRTHTPPVRRGDVRCLYHLCTLETWDELTSTGCTQVLMRHSLTSLYLGPPLAPKTMLIWGDHEDRSGQQLF